ncbi:hypothetical protein MUK42_28459 [Musa troglodytarum]|uniref:Uncharacterized protein n=1 Tax=Musa troglodytarum TaxID=320322 RepID=A0A9E7JSU9_9LILI|nr:hypothetical protein MUK42_28459 [Musa troglodytarum]
MESSSTLEEELSRRYKLFPLKGVGHDKVNLAKSRKRQIRVTVITGVLTADLGDLAIGLSIAVLRLREADHYVRRGFQTRHQALGSYHHNKPSSYSVQVVGLAKQQLP